MKNLSITRRQQGFTLIEMMIALLMGSILLAGVLQIFNSTKQTYRMQDNMSRMQENGRFAMDFISKDIRMADFWGCANPATVEKKLNNGNAAFDVFTRTDLTFDLVPTALAGQDNDNGGNDGDADNDENGNSIWDGTDSITLNGALAPGVSLTTPAASLTVPLSVNNNSGLAVDSFVLISDCVSGDIFQITDVTAGDTISHGPGNAGKLGNVSINLGSGPVNPPGLGGTPDANPFNGPPNNDSAQIYNLNFVTYQIQSGSGGQPSLFRRRNGGAFQELVEGIYDMQILYGENTNPPAPPNVPITPNYYVPVNQVTNMANVVSIRIELLVTSRDDNLTRENASYTYNGNTYDGVGSNPPLPTDKRLRRVFSSTIAIRNRLP